MTLHERKIHFILFLTFLNTFLGSLNTFNVFIEKHSKGALFQGPSDGL